MPSLTLPVPAQTVITIARKAGDVIMMIYHDYQMGRLSGSLASTKADQSPLTQADLAAHHVICDALQRLTPNIPVVSEEDENSERFRQDKGQFWLIDPLDGTKEFIACNDEFTVNIALIENGTAILGVVHVPALNTTYWGGPKLGAYRDVGTGAEAIQVGPPRRSASQACRVVASKSHLNAETQAFITRLGVVETIQAGSSLKFCKVAEGAADIYPRLAPTCEWDTAAAQAVLEGAGGCVVDTQDRPLTYGKGDKLNPWFIASAHRADDWLMS